MAEADKPDPRWDDETDPHELRLLVDGEVAATLERWSSGPQDDAPMWVASGPRRAGAAAGECKHLGTYPTLLQAAAAATAFAGCSDVALPAELLAEWGRQQPAFDDPPPPTGIPIVAGVDLAVGPDGIAAACSFLNEADKPVTVTASRIGASFRIAIHSPDSATDWILTRREAAVLHGVLGQVLGLDKLEIVHG